MISDPQLSAFEQERSRLFSLAYRMLGSGADADEVLQEAYLKFRNVPLDSLHEPPAFLTTVTVHLAIERLRERKRRNESYPGPWLAEPLWLEEERLERRDSLRQASLLLLERLAPEERAVFVLREAFELDYAAIAERVGVSESNARKLLERAKEKLAVGRRRRSASREECAQLFQTFLSACVAQDFTELARVLVQDAELISDGGGKVAAALKPIRGRDRVLKFLEFVLGALTTQRVEVLPINQAEALAIWDGERLVTTLHVEFDESGISQLLSVSNPQKLARLERVLRDARVAGSS